MLLIGRQTRKKICSQIASSHGRSSHLILPYGIFIVFKCSCGLTLELFSEGNSLPAFKLLVGCFGNLKKIMKRDETVYLCFWNYKVLHLVKLIVKSKAVEATFFAVPNGTLIF